MFELMTGYSSRDFVDGRDNSKLLNFRRDRKVEISFLMQR
jgi:hypothetical protein